MRIVSRKPVNCHGVSVKVSGRSAFGRRRQRTLGIWLRNDESAGQMWGRGIDLLMDYAAGKISIETFKAAVDAAFPDAFVKMK